MDMYSDPRRNEELGEYEKLIQPEEPEHMFDESEPKLREVNNFIRKARAASSPGPIGITCKRHPHPGQSGLHASVILTRANRDYIQRV
jgi:hypothetical protein